MTQGESLEEIRFILPQRQGQGAREVVQEVWAQILSLPDGEKGFVQVTKAWLDLLDIRPVVSGVPKFA